MEHILISPGKLKLMLTRDDVERYDLTSAVDGECDPESRQSFKALLADAGKLGFDPGNDRLFIQLYPSKDGGAEIYITRLGERLPAANPREKFSVTHIGAFDSLSDLLCCCKRLGGFDSEESESSAFSDEDGQNYYLVLSESLTCREFLENGLRIDAIIGEYGQKIKPSGAIYYIKEHCFEFCEKRAVKILGSMV